MHAGHPRGQGERVDGGQVREVVGRAVTCPLSLGLLAASSLLLLTPPLWSFALAGFLGDALLVAALLRSESFARSIREDARRWERRCRSARVTEVQSGVDLETRELLGRIEQLHERLLGELDAAAARGAGDRMGFSRGQVSGLLDQCLRLARKRHALVVYLQETQPLALQTQAVRLEEQWERCRDDVARQLYEQALRQKRGELENYSAIQAAVARIDGQLAAVECSFGNLLGRVVRLKSADATHAGVARDQLCRDLEELTAGIRALEESVNETLAT
jgi:hypothetical protein